MERFAGIYIYFKTFLYFLILDILLKLHSGTLKNMCMVVKIFMDLGQMHCNEQGPKFDPCYHIRIPFTQHTHCWG